MKKNGRKASSIIAESKELFVDSLKLPKDTMLGACIVTMTGIDKEGEIYDMDKKETFKLADGNERVVISRVDYNVLSSLLPEKILQKKSYLPRCGIFKATHRQRGKRVDLDNDEIELSLQETMWLRSNVVKYMNILEIIMYAWAADDVSRDIIEKEFSYLVTTERDGNVVLKEFRTAMGNENYPAINAFCQEMEERNKKRILQIKERV